MPELATRRIPQPLPATELADRVLWVENGRIRTFDQGLEQCQRVLGLEARIEGPALAVHQGPVLSPKVLQRQLLHIAPIVLGQRRASSERPFGHGFCFLPISATGSG